MRQKISAEVVRRSAAWQAGKRKAQTGQARARRVRAGQVWFSVAVAGLAGLLVAGCGSGSSSSASSSSSSSFVAYQNCLRQHGVDIPTSPPSGAPGSGGFGGFGGGGSGGSGSGSSTFAKAAQACQSLRPSFGGGGFGGGSGGFAAAFEAFRTCMSDHGEPIPTTRPTSPPAAGSSRQDRFLNGLNPSNSKVAAALKACDSKLPSFAQ